MLYCTCGSSIAQLFHLALLLVDNYKLVHSGWELSENISSINQRSIVQLSLGIFPVKWEHKSKLWAGIVGIRPQFPKFVWEWSQFSQKPGALAVIQAEKMKPFFLSLLYEEAWGKIGSSNGLPKKQTQFMLSWPNFDKKEE